MSNDFPNSWSHMKDHVQEYFRRLTDDDLKAAKGSTDKILGFLQERYGYSKVQAQDEWVKFMRKYSGDLEAAKDTLNEAAAHYDKSG